jgi:hypothetical protein
MRSYVSFTSDAQESADIGIESVDTAIPPEGTQMKLKALALALFVSGLLASYALAAPGKGHGHGKGKGHAAAAADSTTTTSNSKKATLCHKAGDSGRWVKISVSVHAVNAHMKHGDVAPDASGNCPAPTQPTTTEQTSTDESSTDESSTDQSTTTSTDETTTTTTTTAGQ